ncbi:MAG: zinc metallopeptidase [Flavobacteriales bacterium]
MFGDLYLGPWIIGIGVMLIGMIVSFRLKSKFKQYSETPLISGMSGQEVAEKMLRDHGINNVQIICTPGQLTDHYNPSNRTVNLSKEVYYGRNAAATAVAAHEVGHAVQHATAYSMLQFRSAMVPVQNVSGTIINIIVMASIFGGAYLYETFPMQTVLYVIIGAYSMMTMFTLITLPVEFDASKRALAWMTASGVVTSSEKSKAQDALKWAAMTYVVAALGAVLTLLYYISLLAGSRD